MAKLEIEAVRGSHVESGSWGDVYCIYSSALEFKYSKFFEGIEGVGGLMIKFARVGVDDDRLVREGDHVAEYLLEEMRTGLKQSENGGIPPVFQLAWVSFDDDQMTIFDSLEEENLTPALIMPAFENPLLDVIDDGLGIERDREIMNDLMDRIKLMFDPVISGEDVSYGQPKRMLNLIVDGRMRSKARGDNDYPFAEEAKLVNARIEVEIDSLGELIKSRITKSKYGSQHGDPRPDNIMIVYPSGGGVSAVILDAVRLGKYEGNPPEPRLMKEWFMTDVILQAGMALGRYYVEGRDELFKAGVEAYVETFGDDVVGDKELFGLFGVGLIYGISVESHVISYEWDELMIELAAEDLEDKREEEISNKLYELTHDLTPYWNKMTELAKDFSSWREEL